jgi:deoxyribodipyrimidine photo-lyase
MQVAARSQGPVIVWFRRDLRLADNPALRAAADGGRPVIPVYVLDETEGVRPAGAAGAWWLDKSLRSLSGAIEEIGSKLVLRRGPAADVIAALAAETGAAGVTWNRLYEPAAAERDAALSRTLQAAGVEVQGFDASLLSPPGAVKTGQGGAYKVFTAYWRQARQRLSDPKTEARPGTLRASAEWPRSDDLAAWRLHPSSPDWSQGFAWTPGESGAHAALERFIDTALAAYSTGRDLPAVEGSSRLSPHLHWGELSARQVWRRLELARHAHDAPDAQVEKFLAELGWRDFNHQLLADAPGLPRKNLDRRFDAFPWRDDAAGLEAWKRGMTGYPPVDAAMRQLWSTGWMHNRMRMVAASFLIKHLLIDWRQGEAWLWDTLVDADLANNTANWQWVAGSGADAQPFFRIFNPVAQGQRYDAGGAYVRRWVPELAALPDKVVHAPWTASPGVLAKAGVRLGETYPHPVVDHGAARERALDAYRSLRRVDGPER